MDFLESTDIILTIIELLSIIDTRNLLRSCKKLYLLSSNKFISLLIDGNSLIWEEKINSAHAKQGYYYYCIELKNLSEIEKYTSEIICYDYIHLLPCPLSGRLESQLCCELPPQRYIHESNVMILINSKIFNKIRPYVFRIN